MCFNQPMSAVFVAIGLLCAAYVYFKSKNWWMTSGVLYFVGMELLQFFQYYWIDQCDNFMNQALTVVGFLHICFQPFFTHLMNGAFIFKPESKAKFDLILKLALIQGCWMFSRWLFLDTPSTERSDWLVGDKLCTLMGTHHLGWSLPLQAPTYFTPSNSIHLFMMFAPFIALGPRLWLSGFILFATGPLLAWFLTGNLFEQAAIWCFMSIGQIVILTVVLAIRLRGKWTPAEYKPKPKAPTFQIGNRKRE